MRNWRLSAGAPPSQGPPLPSTISQRGLCLLAIEFLTRHSTPECVVTSASLDYWDSVFDMFPKTLFHVFCSQLEDPPRANVIRHGARFDCQSAAAWGARGAPYNMVFTGECMDTQLGIYMQGRPFAALMLVTRPVQEYAEGELLYPLHCAQGSGLCALVPSPGPARLVPYAGLTDAMREFQARARGPGSRYDNDAEDLILTGYAGGICGIGCSGPGDLMVQMTRNSLPARGPDVIFWEPPADNSHALPAWGPDVIFREPPAQTTHALPAGDLEALLAAAMGVFCAEPGAKPDPGPEKQAE